MNNKYIVDNILSTNNKFLEDFNSSKLLEGIANRLKQRRLELNLTQKALAKKSGVSFGSLKHFENKHEISLKSIVKLAIFLNETENLKQLFIHHNFETISDVINIQQLKPRKRGRKNV
ncbi:MAG: helix-turn-helix transcriptional regulator [Endomicrobium sp.]|jgi:transcriptional regulator with XRE-family HTH domain|nr:helix-turn-helix transcriptional regulator [Endomicrobium sp.]